MDKKIRKQSPDPPKGSKKIKWYSPGLLWMLSAVGTGSILFTPRVASKYEYTFIWLLILVVFFMWIMIREMARYTIVTGESMLAGMNSLRGPKGWAVWLIFLPQLLAASVGIAGLCGIVGSAMAAFLPGGQLFHSILILLLCTLFTGTGNYERLEFYSRILSILLILMTVVAAITVFSNFDKLSRGFVPAWPEQMDYSIVLPWVGTILAGSMGIIWFGYWTAKRGFGGGFSESSEDNNSEDNREVLEKRITSWNGIMTTTASLGVVGGLVVLFSFMVLGAELLAPENIMPKGKDVAIDLAGLFSGVWGEPGKYFLLVSIVIAIGGSVLANQDGWGRSFADMTVILYKNCSKKKDFESEKGFMAKLLRYSTLKKVYIVSVTGLFPLLILLTFEDPVKVMSVSGIVAVVHTPFIVFLSLAVNRLRLPGKLQPGLFSSICMFMSGAFYLGFATIYFLDLVGVI